MNNAYFYDIFLSHPFAEVIELIKQELIIFNPWRKFVFKIIEYVNIDLFIRMHIAKEATLSSRIEGTRTNMEDAFMDLRDVATEKRNDWEEVQITSMQCGKRYIFCTPCRSHHALSGKPIRFCFRECGASIRIPENFAEVRIG